MADVQEFLNPHAAITPGVAGGLTALITNALANNFALPANWVGLTVAALLATVVLKSDRQIPPWQKVGLYVLNALIVFAIALGANTAVVATGVDPVGFQGAEPGFFRPWF